MASGYHLGSISKSINPHAKPTDAVPHNSLSYENIRDACLKDGVLFEDPDFPAVNKTMYFSKEPPRQFEWKRPKEIVDDPKMFVEGVSRFDIAQGMLGYLFVYRIYLSDSLIANTENRVNCFVRFRLLLICIVDNNSYFGSS